MSQRCEVTESYGYGTRAGIRINERTAPRTVSASRANALVRELKRYASGFADSVSDVTDTETGVRLVTGHHWVNGFENVRQISVRPVA